MKRFILAVLAAFFLCGQATAIELPVIVPADSIVGLPTPGGLEITGPVAIAAGRAACFDVAGADATEPHVWVVALKPPEFEFREFREVESDSPIGQFIADTPGTYVITFLAIQEDGAFIGGQHEVAVGPPPIPPDPPPPDPPDPPGPDPPPNPPDPPPAPEIPAPTADMQRIVRPITLTIRGEHAAGDGRAMAEYFLQLRDVLQKDADTIATTAVLREANRRATALMFAETGISGRYTGLSDAFEKAMTDVLGLKIRDIDPATRRLAAEIIEAMAWACLEATK